MIRTKKNYYHVGRRTLWMAVLATVYLFLNACSRYTFAPSGFIVNGDPTYYNDSMKFSVALSGDYKNFRKENKTGFKVNGLLGRSDRRMLRYSTFDKRRCILLFSGRPVSEPFYNLIAYITPGTATGIDTSEYETGFVGFKPAYYFKVGKKGKTHVSHSVIPFDGGFLHFVHYQNEAEYAFCRNCDFQKINEDNVQEIQKGESYSLAFNDCNCATGGIGGEILIVADSLIQNERSLLKVYKRPVKELVCFRLLDGSEEDFLLPLCSGQYVIEYTDLQNKAKWRKEVTVK